MAWVGLSRRALRDLEDIGDYSEARWAETVDHNYLDSIGSGLDRLRQQPELLRTRRDISQHFQFYRVREHCLVCLKVRDRIYVLAITHTSMDLPQRLIELEPQLLLEAKLLHAAFLASKRK